ncbi:hypothetical protein GCM10008955_01850 [Deinococcus malanensis]|uniref:Histidine phosphatase family protein n=1 Tax=Deinococcus malanensis TaxID=1706855 RepID=A0ABQ2ELL1_9DEIO|nr:histidine phosphatase family protein [Deinococcus malanensis]GGK12237.1 hypothetical protein GCM10008955_01850 [Deinococcus malanensis]
MERLFLVRHAETLVMGPKVLRGGQSQSDVLSERGHRQAARCGTTFASLRLNRPAVYASTFLRAQQTAHPLAAALGIAVTVVDGLQEMETGDWYGRPHDDLNTHGHELFGGNGDFGFPGGESRAEVERRLCQALTQILNQGGTPIIVSHGLALQILLCGLLATDFAAAWADGRFRHANGAISELRGTARQWRAVRLRCAQHLRVDDWE